MAEKDRGSLRLPGYDYSQAGAYFVTIVTHQRRQLFGVIDRGEMRLNDLGRIVEECWCALPGHFWFVELGAHVVMPNHAHGIITISDSVGARHASPPRINETSARPRGVVPGSLGAIVGSFKSAVTKRRGNAPTGIWQRNYYDHVIRDEQDLQNKTVYIEANTMLWEDDDENLHNDGGSPGTRMPD